MSKKWPGNEWEMGKCFIYFYSGWLVVNFYFSRVGNGGCAGIGASYILPYAECWHRGDIERSPFTVAEVDLCRRRPPLDDGPTNLLVTSLRLERTSYRFSVSLLVLCRTDHSTLLVLTTVPDLRGARGPGPRPPTNTGPPTKSVIFYLSFMLVADKTDSLTHLRKLKIFWF